MIRLTKKPEPDVLVRNGGKWLKEIEDKLAIGQVPTDNEKNRYRNPEIKSVLKVETHGKCAYCESFLAHIAFGDVEHISPKSHKLADTFRWENLTLACDMCNTYKGESSDIVDPYIDNPTDYFQFLGPLIYAFPEHDKGVVTLRQLRLNRVDLIQTRSKRLGAIATLILTIQSTTNTRLKQVLVDDLLQNEVGDDTEYAAFVRSLLKAVNPDLKVTPDEIGDL